MHKRRMGPAKMPPPPSTPNVDLSPEDAQKLDYEICWCIEELENLMAKKSNDKQKKEQELCLRILKSPETPLIKKRQVMRQHFGDYRQKISESKTKRNVHSNVSTVNIDKAPSVNSVFIRKHQKLNEINGESNDVIEKSTAFSFKPSDNSFKFNFQ